MCYLAGDQEAQKESAFLRVAKRGSDAVKKVADKSRKMMYNKAKA